MALTFLSVSPQEFRHHIVIASHSSPPMYWRRVHSTWNFAISTLAGRGLQMTNGFCRMLWIEGVLKCLIQNTSWLTQDMSTKELSERLSGMWNITWKSNLAQRTLLEPRKSYGIYVMRACEMKSSGYSVLLRWGFPSLSISTLSAIQTGTKKLHLTMAGYVPYTINPRK